MIHKAAYPAIAERLRYHDASDIHAHLDDAVRGLRRDLAWMNDAVRLLRDQPWLDAWRDAGAHISAAHDGDRVVLIVEGDRGRAVEAKFDVLGMLLNWRSAVPFAFEEVIRLWVHHNVPPATPLLPSAAPTDPRRLSL